MIIETNFFYILLFLFGLKKSVNVGETRSERLLSSHCVGEKLHPSIETNLKIYRIGLEDIPLVLMVPDSTQDTPHKKRKRKNNIIRILLDTSVYLSFFVFLSPIFIIIRKIGKNRKSVLRSKKKKLLY